MQNSNIEPRGRLPGAARAAGALHVLLRRDARDPGLAGRGQPLPAPPRPVGPRRRRGRAPRARGGREPKGDLTLS